MIPVPFSGDRWPGTTIRIAYPREGWRWGDCRPEGYEVSLSRGWSPLTPEDIEVERQVSASIAASAGLKFVEVEPEEAQIRIARSPGVKLWGWGFHPGKRFRRSGALFHSPDLTGRDSSPGTRVFCHRLHERMHTLGFRHADTNDPWDAVMAEEWRDCDRYPPALREPDVEAVRRAYGL